MSYYANRHVLITGAASGIGRLMAEKIGVQGGRMILWDVNAEGLAQTKAALEEKGVRADAYTVDLSSREAIQTAAEQTLLTAIPPRITKRILTGTEIPRDSSSPGRW